MVRRFAVAAIAVLFALGNEARAQIPISPAIVYAPGGKIDNPMNASASRGVEKFKFPTGTQVAEFEPADASQIEPGLQNLARIGYDPILLVGVSHIPALEKVSKEFPDRHFTLIDGIVNLPNVRSTLFKEHEGSFVVGVVAGLATRSGKIGFIGGMDIPVIRRFQCGFEFGIRHANARAELITSMIGTTPAAWNDPRRGGELAKLQFDRGVDVVFAAAGESGLGALQMAKDRGKYAIGVDTDQNHLFPGTMLTSMVKRFDIAVFETFMYARLQRWQAGRTVLGLKEGGVDWAIDQYNEQLITDDMRTKVEQARAALISGDLVVPDYTVTNACKR